MDIQPLAEGKFFHIYNRGINGESIFKQERNYAYFLDQYFYYCSDVFETWSYVLLKNHFHLFVYVRENAVVPCNKKEGTIRLNASKQLSHFFNSYAQAVNKSESRTGSLFESPFERKLIEHESYKTAMILYCHHNPQLHGFVKDFKDWPYSSYNAILKNDNSFISAEKILTHFGIRENFEKLHFSG